MSDKHTKRELFETLLVFASAAEAEAWVIAGLEHELDLLSRKSKAGAADAKREAEQKAVIRDIRDFLSTATEPLTATEIARGTDYSTQRVSAMLKKMGAERIQDGKKVTFTL